MIIVRKEAFYVSNKVRPMWTAGYHTDRLAWHLVQILMSILSSGKVSGYKAATAAGKVSSESVNEAGCRELRCSLGFSSLPAYDSSIIASSLLDYARIRISLLCSLAPLEETSTSSLIRNFPSSLQGD